MNATQTLADRYRTARIDSGLSQAEAARKIGIKPPSLSQIESGKTRSVKNTTGLRAAELYNVNPRWLTYGIGPKTRDADGTFRPSHRNVMLGQERRGRLATVIRGLQEDPDALIAFFADVDALLARWEILTRPKRSATVVPLREKPNR